MRKEVLPEAVEQSRDCVRLLHRGHEGNQQLFAPRH